MIDKFDLLDLVMDGFEFASCIKLKSRSEKPVRTSTYDIATED